MKTQLNEIKRMQQLAGIITENQINNHESLNKYKQYLLTMIDEFSAGNDNEYPIGKKMEFRYESIEKEDTDIYSEEQVDIFKKTKEFLKIKGPITINDKIKYTFSVDGEDIIVSWIEPDWDKI